MEDVCTTAPSGDSDTCPFSQVRSRSKKAKENVRDTQQCDTVLASASSGGAKGFHSQLATCQQTTDRTSGRRNNSRNRSNKCNDECHSNHGESLSLDPILRSLQDHLKMQQNLISSLYQQVTILSQNITQICSFLGFEAKKAIDRSDPAAVSVPGGLVCPVAISSVDITAGNTLNSPADLSFGVEPCADGGLVTKSTKSTSDNVIRTGSWSSNPPNGSGSRAGAPNVNRSLADIIDDSLNRLHAEREKRAKSIIISGMPERDDDDVPPVLDLLQCEFNFVPSHVHCRRFGVRNNGTRPRLLQVSFDNKDDAAWVIANAHHLRRSRDSSVRQYIFINRNLTSHERFLAYTERQQRRDARSRAIHPAGESNSSLSGVGDTAVMPDINDLSEFPPLRSTSIPTGGANLTTSVSGAHPVESTASSNTGDLGTASDAGSNSGVHPDKTSGAGYRSVLSATALPFDFGASGSGSKRISGDQGRPASPI